MTQPIDLPLFPLGTVLFPNQMLPLHVFEERYKMMIGECLRDSAVFGVVLIREGREVGEPAKPFETGTSARIVDAQELSGGRMGLRTIGEQTFRIVSITQERPYMRALVEFRDYDETSAEDTDALAQSVRGRFSAHLEILKALSERETPALDLGITPDRLSYLVASVMSIEMREKQQLLEATSTLERLKAEATILERENRALQTFVYLSQQSKKTGPEEGGASHRFSQN